MITFVLIASSVWMQAVSRWVYISDGTYIEDMKDPGKFQPSSHHCLFVILRMEESRDLISFTPLDDVPPDLSHRPASEDSVNVLSNICITGPTHIVNCSIALSTDWLSSFTRLPFTPGQGLNIHERRLARVRRNPVRLSSSPRYL